MLSKQIFLICACVLGFSYVQAQSIEKIKGDNTYVWGEGTGVTTDEAEQQALGQMGRSISVSIYNVIVDSEDNGKVIQKNILQSVSSARFQNVQIKILSEEPNAHVFCYMRRSDVEKMFKERDNRIADLIETGKTAEKRLQIDDALRCYYWALLLVKSNPKDIAVNFAEKEGLASSLLPLKIKSVLKKLKAEVTEGTIENGKVNARIHFTYDGKDVSSLQYTFHDGQSIVGPIAVRDGIGEVELVGVPADGKLHLTYETRFKNEVDPIDSELYGMYASGMLPAFNASNEVPVKVKGGTVKAGKPVEATSQNEATIAPEPPVEKKPIEMRSVASPNALHEAVMDVEAAIRENNPGLAYKRFTTEGYKLFCKLMTETGQVSLSGKSNYEFVEAEGYLTGRSTRIKIKFRNGKAFMENLVYRFNPKDEKIESVAFALTKQAENDIMNAAASWPEVSRWAILNFMEDYQTAFALKRLDYISSIFSENAVIITGTVLKNCSSTDQVFDGQKLVDFGTKAKDVRYSRHTKSEYIKRLGEIFKKKEYVHLTFENNVTQLIKLPSVVENGAAFGIEIRQRYTSPSYSDEGYLTLAFDTRGEHPIIHVRLWQPDKTERVSLQEFISKFSN